MIVFDFDGTLANTHELMFRHYKTLIRQKKWLRLAELDADLVSKIQNKNMFEARKDMRLPMYKLLIVMPMLRRSMAAEYSTDLLVPGMLTVLQQCHQHQIPMAIVSTNNRHAIQSVLAEHCELFTHIYSNCFHNKARVLKKLLNTYGNTSPVTYVTDSSADIMASKKAGCQSVGVGWGLHQATFLKQHQPNHVTDTPDALLTYLKTAYHFSCELHA